jgi:Tfp pilus assembly protein PilX
MREEGGWSLIELMLTCVLLIIVMGGTLSLLDTSAKIAPQEQERANAIRDAQVGLARMTRELRQATQVISATASTVSVKVPVAGVSQTVTYTCTDACRRTQGSSTEVVIARVLNGSTVFTFDGGNYFEARIEVPAKGERAEGLRHDIVLDDGFYLRNVP